MTGQTRLCLDVSRCVGVGQCELLEPEIFRVADDTGTSTVISAPILPSQRAEALVDQCPSGAIQIDPDVSPTPATPPGTD
jgi:ferredoxin